MNEENALIVVGEINPVVLFSDREQVDGIMRVIREKATSLVPDISTEAGRRDVVSMAFKVARSKTLLDEMGKDLVADMKAKVKVIDGYRKIIRDNLDELKAEVRQPMTDWEAEEEHKRVEAARKEEERKAAILGKIENIKNAVSFDTLAFPLEELEGVKNEIDAIIVDETTFQEFLSQATSAKEIATGMISRAIENRKQALAEEAARKAEVERLEKIRQEQVVEAARLAEEQRKIREAQEAERKRLEEDRRKIDEAQDAERRKIAAEQEAERQKLQVERDAINAERRKIESEKQAEADRKEQERLNTEKAAMEAREAQERAQKEKAEQEARANAEAERKAREEALRPDKERVKNWARGLLDISPCIGITDKNIEKQANDALYAVNEIGRQLLAAMEGGKEA